MADQWRDTCVGLLRRTGPTTAELLMTDTGDAYAINWAAMPMPDDDWDPRHTVDSLFMPNPDHLRG